MEKKECHCDKRIEDMPDDLKENMRELGDAVSQCAISMVEFKTAMAGLKGEIEKFIINCLIADFEVKQSIYIAMCEKCDESPFIFRWLWILRMRKAERIMQEAKNRLEKYKAEHNA